MRSSHLLGLSSLRSFARYTLHRLIRNSKVIGTAGTCCHMHWSGGALHLGLCQGCANRAEQTEVRTVNLDIGISNRGSGLWCRHSFPGITMIYLLSYFIIYQIAYRSYIDNWCIINNKRRSIFYFTSQTVLQHHWLSYLTKR